MPGRDGSGPLGQGSRTGRGLGNCSPTSVNTTSPSTTGTNRPFHWGGRVWDATVGRLFRRRPANRGNRR